LTHIERLQFNDASIVLVPGLNQEPIGELTIVDAVTGDPVVAPTEGQLLRVVSDGLLDFDNPRGTVHGLSFVWQSETAPGSGVFEDLVPRAGAILVRFRNAEGTTFFVDPAFTGEVGGLDGLALRVRAVYEDAHGVTEQAFSAATGAVISIPTPPV